MDMRKPMREAKKMAKYVTRKCPQCRECLGVLIVPHNDETIDSLIDGYCSRCGYELHWFVMPGIKKYQRLKLIQEPWLRLVSSASNRG